MILGSRNACGCFWTPFSWAGVVEERLVLAGRTLIPPRECFRRKPARQLPLSVMTPPVKRQFWKIRVCVAMKAPVGLSSRRAVCVSRWKGFALTSVRTATNAKNKNQIPLNMPRVQQRRPLPAAEAGRSCWGRGQQDTNAAQGMKWMRGAATLGGHSKSFNQR